MKALIDRFSSLVKGVFSGFDRIVFKGWILPLMSISQVTSFLGSKGVLNKDYKNWMVARTKEIVSTTEQYARDNCGQPTIHIPTWRIRKEELGAIKSAVLSTLPGLRLSNTCSSIHRHDQPSEQA